MQDILPYKNSLKSIEEEENKVYQDIFLKFFIGFNTYNQIKRCDQQLGMLAEL